MSKALHLVAIALTGMLVADLGTSVIGYRSVANAQTTLDSKAEAERLLNLCREHLNKNEAEAALKSCQQAITAHQLINDLSGEAKSTVNLGVAYRRNNQVEKAISTLQSALILARKAGEVKVEGITLNNLGYTYEGLKQYQRAIDFYQQALVINKQTGDLNGEGITLSNLGGAYYVLEQHQKAISYYQEALVIAQKLGNLSDEGDTLGNIGTVYRDLGEYQKSIDFLQKSLVVVRQIGDLKSEGNALINIGNAYVAIAKYDKAIDFYQQSLEIRKQIGDRKGEGFALVNLGRTYNNLGQYQKSISLLEQSLNILKQVGDQNSIATILNNLGNAYDNLGKYDKAINFYQRSVALAQNLRNRRDEAYALANLGNIHVRLGQYQQAIDSYQQSLSILRQIGNRQGVASLVGNLASTFFRLGQYQQAIESLRESLKLAQQIGDRQGESVWLFGLGNAYFRLGQYDQSIDFYQKSLDIAKQIGDPKSESDTLIGLANSYNNLDNYQQGIDFLQQALSIKKRIGDRQGEGASLGNIGNAYIFLGESQKAIDFLQRSLVIKKEIGDRYGEANTLSALSKAYFGLRQYEKTIDFSQQSLKIAKQIKDINGEDDALNNLGAAFTQIDKLTLAISVYKQSILISETLRQNVPQTLTLSQQKDFQNSIDKSYKNLTNNLLKQNRIVEALQIIDLRKQRDLREFYRTDKDSTKTDGIYVSPEEKQLFAVSKDNFLAALKDPQVTQISNQIESSLPNRQTQISTYTDLNSRLSKLGKTSALLFPIVLADRLELILLTPNKPPISRTVKITSKDLETNIDKFRIQLSNPELTPINELNASAQQLHQSLIAPISADLQTQGIDTIFYAPDGKLRYIPIAALYDGKEYLTQRYRINHVTTFSLTDPSPRPTNPPRILAAAFDSLSTQYTFPILNEENSKNETKSFGGFGTWDKELDVFRRDNLVTGSTWDILKDQSFSSSNLSSKLPQADIVFLLTHGLFLNSNPYDSFILMGNGEKVSLKDTEKWKLNKPRLVVFSACQTGLGTREQNGLEVIGFGYQMQKLGVRATVSTLWSVDTQKTALLLHRFNRLVLQEGKAPADALRQMQSEAIQATAKGQGIRDRSKIVAFFDLDSDDMAQISHPYFWSPFFITGNGL